MSSLCLSSKDVDAGLDWASKKAKNSLFWTVHVSFKKDKITVPIQPSNPVIVCVEFLLDAYSSVEASSIKILYKGRKLDMSLSFEEQGVNDGAKLMMIASSTQDIDTVQTSRSDPTIRGFDAEKRLDRGRARGLDPSSSSAWRSEQHREYKFSKLEMVGYEVGECTPHPYEAQKLLTKLATDPGIIACMCEHRWHVSKLCEMDPRSDKPKKEGACTLGYNENFGARIYIRLRTDDLKQFRPYRELINTLLHELAHNVFGPHGPEFWTLFSSLKMTYLTCHAELQRKGTMVGGLTSGKLADISDSGDAQDVGASVTQHLSAEANNSALSSFEREAAAAVAARMALIQPLMNTQASSITTMKQPPPMSARAAAALAAEKRMQVQPPLLNKPASDKAAEEEDISMIRDEKSTQEVVKSALIEKETGRSAEVVSIGLSIEKETIKTEEMVVDAGVQTTDQTDSTTTSRAGSELQTVATIEHTHRDLVADEVNFESFSEQLGIIAAALETIKVAKTYGDSATASTATTTLSTLSKIVGNIVSNPNEMKYHQFKKSSNVYKLALASSSPALELLQALGFNDQLDGVSRVMNPNIALFTATRDLLHDTC